MKIKKEVQIGLLAIVAVALGYIGVNFLKGIEVFKKTSIYYAHFDNLSGISAAAPVEASGFKVGNVRSVAFDYSRGYGATLELALDDDMRIPVGSQLKIKSNPLGSAELVLVINPQSQTYLSEGDTIASQDAGDGLLSSVSEKILPAIAGMIPTITNTLERLNALLNDKSIDSMLYGLSASTQQLHGMMAGLN
ncbi:MAG: MCE family protein, partial [Porphyromonas sp.]|nr:MCE family protein [Porphyromonas sp.]